MEQNETGSVQPAELGHMEMNISAAAEVHSSLSDKEVGVALKVRALHVKIMLLRTQSTLFIEFRAKHNNNRTSSDP